MDLLTHLHEVDAALNRLDLACPEDLRTGVDLVARTLAQLLPGIRVDVGLDAACSLADGERAVTAKDRLLADVFAQRLGAMVDLARQREELRRDRDRKEEELARLRRAALLISSRTGLEETLQSILQMALEVTGARYGIFRLMDEGRLVTRAVAGEGLTRPLVEALPLDATSITGWVATHLEPVCVRDLREEPWSRLYYPLDERMQMRSELAVPLLGAGGRLEGVLNLESPQVGGFGDADRQLLETLATQAVIAIQEVRLLDALQEIAERLLRDPAPTVLRRIEELACSLLGGESASFQGTLQVHGARESDWGARVVGCLAHHAALAVEGEERREALRATRERRAAAESLAVLGDLAANMMHRLNNKVGTIPVRIQGIQERCEIADPYLRRNLLAIDAAAREAMQAVQESVQVLRPGDPTPVRLHQAVEAALREARLPAPVTVRTEGLEEVPPVQAGERGLTLIFVNLLENASRAMGGRGDVHIEARDGEVRVRDTGPGIPADQREAVFELRVSEKAEGLGFGLWWVRTLMTRLGGSITVADEGPGATFVLRFPR